MAAICAVFVLAGCGDAFSASMPDESPSVSQVLPQVKLPMPGEVVQVEDWASSGSSISGSKVLYRSTDVEDEPVIVSGTVFKPEGVAPVGGWPVLAVGHGSTGINANCAPSLTDNLYGLSRLVKRYLDAGFAVTFPDFSGMGTNSGPHPYLDSYAAARTMIDSVRAIREVYHDISDTWVSYGISQGGGATWAADEIAGQYAPELHLAGAVAQVPTTTKVPMVDLAAAGALTPEQQGVLQWLEESLARRNPDLDLNALRSPALAAQWAAMSDCGQTAGRDAALRRVSAQDFRPATPAAGDKLKSLLQEMALPRAGLSAPLYVLYGGGDRFNDARWTTDAVGRACELGGPITVDFQPAAGHTDVSTGDVEQYLLDRIAGLPVRNDCRR